MTPPDKELNLQQVFGVEDLTVYRLVRRKYANLSGKGAALSPGRWNVLGEGALYTSLDPATTVLERLAHTPKGKIPRELELLSITIQGVWTGEDPPLVRRSKGTLVALPSLDLALDAFRDGTRHPVSSAFAVALPSVLTPAWNVVLYPQRTGFWEHVKLRGSEPFTYDPRLFPEDATQED